MNPPTLHAPTSDAPVLPRPLSCWPGQPPPANRKSPCGWPRGSAGEIISVDSMQVYRGLDIGTAKPSPAERARVPHHLIDVVDLTEPFDAAQFISLAHGSRGRHPGPRPACRSCAAAPGSISRHSLKDWARPRRRTPPCARNCEPRPAGPAARTGRARPGDLRTHRPPEPAPGHSRHRGHSPDRQTLLHPTRGLATRNTQHAARSTQPHTFTPFGLARSSEDLRSGSTRVDAMFRRGWVAETEHLLKRGLAQNQTAMQALGYRQIVEHLRGERSPCPRRLNWSKSAPASSPNGR